MRIRIEDENGDMIFGSGLSNFYISTPEGVGQLVKNELLLILGEWYINLNEGTPYFQGIIGKFSQSSADLQLKTKILSITMLDNGQTIQAVTSIENYSSTLNQNTRSFSMTCTLNTPYGVTQVEIDDYAIF